MPSPFPGMDPYLESEWGDIHLSFVAYVRNRLQKVLPAGLRARGEQRLIISGSDPSHQVRPDVEISEWRESTGRQIQHSQIATASPVLIELPLEMETQHYIEIRLAKSPHRVVTVIEVVSPSNKRGNSESKRAYLQKQSCYVHGSVNLVEIDLIRKGEWVVAVPPDSIPMRMRTTYRVVVRRASDKWNAEYYPIPLESPLPVINIPLREFDEDVPLDLQSILTASYEDGAYDDIDYTIDPEPPLAAADRKWIDQHLRKKGLRKAKKRK